MSVNELIFNKARFFNIDENSLYKAIPKYVTVPEGVLIYNNPVTYDGRTIDHLGDSEPSIATVEVPCFGVEDMGNFGQYYIVLYHYSDGHRGDTGWFHVKVQDVTNVKWGGKTLLSHVWHRIRQALSRESEVSLCL